MVKVILQNREELQDVEDRMAAAIQDHIENAGDFHAGQAKILRAKMAQIKRNTRLMNDEWSDVEEDEPAAKRTKKERLEPEDLILKARLEDLQAKVKETAVRVKQHRMTAPAKIEDAVKRDLESGRDALNRAIAGVDFSKSGVDAAKKDFSMAPACIDAFLDDVSDIAAAAARIKKELPNQLARWRGGVKVCQEWTRKPFSEAEKLVAENAPATFSPQAAADQRRLRTATSLSARR